jgi:P-type conjugative transfer protein TrbG
MTLAAKRLWSLLIVSLAGCAGAPETELLPATLEKRPPPSPTVVKVPEPVLVPQLKALEKPAAPAKAEKPARIIERNNRAARLGPSDDGYVNAVMHYPFMDGVLYLVYCAALRLTHIVLEPGEDLIDVGAGDTVRWVIGTTRAGAGGRQQHIITVKPLRPGLETNLFIATDRRYYQLELRSFKHTYMASVSFDYPHETLARVAKAKRALERQARQSIGPIQLSALNFDYRISGDDPPWRPQQVFDDGAKTYLQFPKALSTHEAPALFVRSRKGETQLVNYRVKGRYYIVDRLFSEAELRAGQTDPEVVSIVREGGDRASADDGPSIE